MNLNELRNKAYQCAIAHGWHEKEHSNNHYLCLIISELMEAVQADRKGKRANVSMFKEWQGNNLPLSEETLIRRFKEDYEAYIKDSVEDELADSLIRLLDLAGLRNIDIDNLPEFDIEAYAECCENETFTESIYYVSTIPTMLFYEYDYQLEKQLNSMILSVFGISFHLDIDLFWHIQQKMRYNELRTYKHGNKKY